MGAKVTAKEGRACSQLGRPEGRARPAFLLDRSQLGLTVLLPPLPSPCFSQIRAAVTTAPTATKGMGGVMVSKDGVCQPHRAPSEE